MSISALVLGRLAVLRRPAEGDMTTHISQRDSIPRTSETRTISFRLSVVILPASARSSQVATVGGHSDGRERDAGFEDITRDQRAVQRCIIDFFSRRITGAPSERKVVSERWRWAKRECCRAL